MRTAEGSSAWGNYFVWLLFHVLGGTLQFHPNFKDTSEKISMFLLYSCAENGIVPLCMCVDISKPTPKMRQCIT